MKKEGDSFSAGESLCEVSLSDFSLAVDHENSGIIAEIIAANGKTVEADHPIASYVHSKDEYLEYVEKKREMVLDQERMSGIKEHQEEKNRKPDKMTLMREIKHLIQSGAIQEGSGGLCAVIIAWNTYGCLDFAKKIQSLARKGNPELMSVFMASFDGASFNDDTFDVKFFLDNAKDVIADAEK